MPRRYKALAALLLAIVICLVLVLPQVDLDDGVLRDFQTQALSIVFLGLAAELILLLPPGLSYPLRQVRWEYTLHPCADASAVVSLRC